MYTWEVLAYWAYNAYLAHGQQGAMVIPVTPDGLGKPKWVIGTKNNDSELEQYIAEYDPEDEIIVGFEFTDGRITFGRYGADNYPPPAAYAAVIKKYGKETQE
jgi:hypothetical protein